MNERLVYILPMVDVETGEVKEIPRDELLGTKGGKHGLLFRWSHDDRIYRFPRNQEEIETAWFNAGWRAYDATNVVNMNQAKSYDFARGTIFFERDPSKDSLYATVAKINEKDLIADMAVFNIRGINDPRYAATPAQFIRKPRMV